MPPTATPEAQGLAAAPAPPPAVAPADERSASSSILPEMTGRKLAETVFGSRRENDLIAWRVETGSDGLGWPEVTRQGNLLVADDQGVASIAPDGRIAWRHPREAWTHARPKSTSDGGCVWSPGNGGLVGLDPQGRPRWRWGEGLQMQTIQPALGPDDTAYVCVRDEGWKLQAVGSDGQTRWSASLDMHASSPPVVHPDGKVSVRVDLAEETLLSTFDPQGQKLHQANIPGRVEGRPALAPDGSVWIGNDSGGLFRVSAEGQLSQVFQARGGIRAMPRIEEDGRVFFGTMKGMVYGLEPDGTKAWEVDLKGMVESRIERMADGTLLVGTFDKVLHALTPEGQSKWQMPLPFAGGDALAVSNDGTVYAAGGRQVLALREGGIQADLGRTGSAEPPADGTIATEGDDWVVIGDVKLPVRRA
jgi:hypothetical protein